jgi:hypothetical protein
VPFLSFSTWITSTFTVFASIFFFSTFLGAAIATVDSVSAKANATNTDINFLITVLPPSFYVCFEQKITGDHSHRVKISFSAFCCQQLYAVAYQNRTMGQTM